jgi:hypothetical protein
MDRRRWLKGVGAAALLGGAGLGAVTAAVRFRAHPYFVTLDEVKLWLEAIDPARMKSTGVWTVPQILSHAAQSIEFSLAGFPEMKPPWFRHTVGASAFAVFSALGGMRHGLSDFIPGTSATDLLDDPQRAKQRLAKAVAEFLDSEEVKPHFAYGELSWQQLDQAHAMHLSEHLVEVVDA